MLSTETAPDDVRTLRRESTSGLGKGLDGLAMLVQGTLKEDPFSGHMFAFRGRKATMLKILFWDGNGLCLFSKRLDQGSFVWPVMAGFDGSITLTPAQLAMLVEDIDWRAPERVWNAFEGRMLQLYGMMQCLNCAG